MLRGRTPDQGRGPSWALGANSVEHGSLGRSDVLYNYFGEDQRNLIINYHMRKDRKGNFGVNIEI